MTLISCGPRSGISNDNEPPICGVKDYSLTDTNKIIPRTKAEISGLNLFRLHCKQCHAPPDIYPDNNVAHSLRGLFDRLPKGDYFIVFLQNSDSLKKSDDPYSNKLDAEIKSDYEHRFKNILSRKDINDISEYIKLESRTSE